MKYTQAEQLHRKRERNKLHAKKTRERKRHQTALLQNRIDELKEEGDLLRQLIDERVAANSILLLSGSEVDTQFLKNSTEVCRNYYAEAVSEQEVWSSKDVELPSPNKRAGRGGDKATIEEKEVRR